MAGTANNNAGNKSGGDTIVMIDLSGKNHDTVRALYEYIQQFPGYATDDGVLQEDTRRKIGNLQLYRAAFVFHTP